MGFGRSFRRAFRRIGREVERGVGRVGREVERGARSVLDDPISSAIVGAGIGYATGGLGGFTAMETAGLGGGLGYAGSTASGGKDIEPIEPIESEKKSTPPRTPLDNESIGTPGGGDTLTGGIPDYGTANEVFTVPNQNDKDLKKRKWGL